MKVVMIKWKVKGRFIKEYEMMSYSESQKKATERYKAKAYKRVPLDMRVEEYEAMKDHVEKTGETVNGFLRRIIREEIERAGD